MKSFNLYQIFFLIFMTVITLSLSIAQAQDSRQQLKDLVSPEPGYSINEFQRLSPKILSAQQIPEKSGTLFNNTNIFTVTTIEDNGNGSLRQAITDANLNFGQDIIQFDIPGTGAHIIQPGYPLPEITDPVIIDGTTQPGYSSKPSIEIDGINAGISNGLIILADNCIIKGIAITRFSRVGIGLIGEQNIIEGCFIGIGTDGLTNKGNALDGIVIFSANNLIGNPNGARNVISGNGLSGIRISEASSTGNRIRNNYIGTNWNGSSPVGNLFSGIYIYQSSQDTIGGLGFSGMNVISGNLNAGIRIEGGLSQNIVITTNRIGTTANGSSALGNQHGIEIIYGTGGAAGSPSNILIGGKWSEAQNLISGNLQAGVAFFFDATNGEGNIVAGNLIGTDATGNNSIPNTHGIYIERVDTTGIMPGIKIGGSIVDSSNVISGNSQFGVWIEKVGARNNLIFGNYIGTTRATITGIINPRGNGFAGVYIDSASGNSVGDVDIMRGNVIGDNGGDGIAIIGSTAYGNFIYNNFIGTEPQIGRDLGNQIDGIYIEGSSTRVGGSDLMNEIAFNHGNGISVFAGTKNRLNGNAIYKNGIMGIDLAPLDITPNDSADLDLGANLGQNFPILDSASLKSNSITIHGRFYSKPNTQYTLYFYKNDQRSPSHFGEGQFFIDSLLVTTNDSGWIIIDRTFNESISDTQFITALAVDSDGNTSEFSRALCLKDTDGDGIFDCWETEGDGIDVDCDGIIDLNLWAKGARFDHKDIFVEVDYMFDYRPFNSSLDSVHAAFASVPNIYLNNPDGQDGVNLIIEIDDNSMPIQNEVLPANPWPRFFELKEQFFGTDGERANTYSKEILEAKMLVYRFVSGVIDLE